MVLDMTFRDFEAEYLVRKIESERDYEEVIRTLSNAYGNLENDWNSEKRKIDN